MKKYFPPRFFLSLGGINVSLKNRCVHPRVALCRSCPRAVTRESNCLEPKCNCPEVPIGDLLVPNWGCGNGKSFGFEWKFQNSVIAGGRVKHVPGCREPHRKISSSYSNLVFVQKDFWISQKGFFPVTIWEIVDDWWISLVSPKDLVRKNLSKIFIFWFSRIPSVQTLDWYTKKLF